MASRASNRRRLARSSSLFRERLRAAENGVRRHYRFVIVGQKRVRCVVTNRTKSEAHPMKRLIDTRWGYVQLALVFVLVSLAGLFLGAGFAKQRTNRAVPKAA